MKELLLEIQRNLKEWYKREPEDIVLVCVSKKELAKLNRKIFDCLSVSNSEEKR